MIPQTMTFTMAELQYTMEGSHMPMNLQKFPSWIIIIRCIHERGQSQQDALVELKRRGLWLAEEQAKQAGITREQAGLGPEKIKEPAPMPWCERCNCYHHHTADHIRGV
jgi:hypothetical protein